MTGVQTCALPISGLLGGGVSPGLMGSGDGVEFDGKRCGPGEFGRQPPGGRAAAPSTGHPPGDDAQCLAEFDSGQVGTEAVVHAAAEGRYRRGRLAGDVQVVGTVVDGRVAVGGRGVGEDERARRDEDAAEFDVLDGDT